jgi:N-formylglutamate amidohydrolase
MSRLILAPFLLVCAGALLPALAQTPEQPAAPPPTKAPLAAAKPEFLITIEPGTLPIVLSAPHGGQEPIPGIPIRQGKNVERFVTSRDGNVDKIALLTAKELEKTLGGRPYLVIARFERKYVDANRAPEAAYEHEAAKLQYDAYHRAIQDALVAIKRDWGRGLVVDIHGQAKTTDGIYRGTVDGESVKQLVKEHGRTAVTGEKSLFGMLAKLGYKVLPGNDDTDQVEHFYNGGHITRSYGSDHVADIDAIQVEFGDKFRKAEHLDKTSADLAAALTVFAKEYLPREKKPQEAAQ